VTSRKNVHEVTWHERDHERGPQGENDVEHVALVLRAPRRRVDEDDTKAVHRVKDNRCNKAGFADPHDGCLVGADDAVVNLGADAKGRGVENVNKEEEVDGDSRDAVKHPRPHTLMTAVESPRDFVFDSRSAVVLTHISLT
jgi:hypothetical protein